MDDGCLNGFVLFAVGYGMYKVAIWLGGKRRQLHDWIRRRDGGS